MPYPSPWYMLLCALEKVREKVASDGDIFLTLSLYVLWMGKTVTSSKKNNKRSDLYVMGEVEKTRGKY